MSFFKKRKYATVSQIQISNVKNYDEEPNVPEGLCVKCPNCGKIVYKKTIEDNNKICTLCGGYFRMNPIERINLICDENSFKEFNEDMVSKNPLNFPGYEDKLNKAKNETERNEGVVTGIGTIYGEKTVIAVMDSNFMMGSMGSVVGEKITRAVEKATDLKLPIIIFTCSGGARMQEGILSLMQMAKISAALAVHDKSKLLYITVLTDPTTGGVTASFGMLGDIILAEPKATVGFAGRRVIEQTIKQVLPEDFQSSEFLLDHGFIDKIVKREELQKVLGTLLKLHKRR